MEHNRWYAVLSAREVPRGRPVGVTRFSEKLVFWRDETGAVCCLADRCCHRGAALSCGRTEAGELCCPFHGFRYDKTGRVVQIPANGRTQPVEGRYRVRAYPVCQSRGFIWLWYGEGGTPTAQPPFFDELADGFSYGEFAETWPVHYTRAIENQLDVVHLPFVHRTTIGRGGKTLVNGPVVRWVGDRMTFYVKNARDLGQRPQRPEEIDGVEHLFSLQLQMPNLWQNRVSDRVRIVAAFAPIDEEHTRIYLRFYQKLTAAPGLCQAVNGLGNLMNRTVLHQDRRVVVTQQPVKSALQMGENLLQGDLPIIEYRMKRQEFLEDGTVF